MLLTLYHVLTHYSVVIFSVDIRVRSYVLFWLFAHLQDKLWNLCLPWKNEIEKKSETRSVIILFTWYLNKRVDRIIEFNLIYVCDTCYTYEE